MRTAFLNNSLSMTGGVETVTTPVDMNISVMDGPLDPVFTRPSLQRTEDMDLDTQPMRGPREQGNITSDILDHFIYDNYGDVLRSSLLNPSSYMSLPSVKTSPQQAQQRTMVMDWYIPNGTNRQVVKIPERKIACLDTDAHMSTTILWHNKVPHRYRYRGSIWLDNKSVASHRIVLFSTTIHSEWTDGFDHSLLCNFKNGPGTRTTDKCNTATKSERR